MATNAQIFEMRLSLKDPLGFISVVEVADAASRPESPAAQTLYFVADVSEYHSFENGDWVRQDVEMSNERMGTFIDLYGETKARYHIVKEFVRSLGQKLYLAQHNNGSESYVYQNLTTMRNFYEAMLDSLKEDVLEESGHSTGRYVKTKRQVVGGML